MKFLQTLLFMLCQMAPYLLLGFLLPVCCMYSFRPNFSNDICHRRISNQSYGRHYWEYHFLYVLAV